AGGTRLVEAAALTGGFVGAAVLGTLTSLDEVLLEVIPVRRGTPDLATGNLFGTIAAFTTAVPGVAALLRPLDVDSAGSLAYLAVAVLYAIIAMAFLLRGRAGRALGAFVLLTYLAWLAFAASV
ncbi:MAG: hypothetical protein M3245_04180, partial [Actinomycetota bacterium]|nr:hypothetical protein [Actinomycetota bacterium]